ncbi:MAG: toxin-antitoxin system TumE family protein [Gammaproteobacteria bacterium]
MKAVALIRRRVVLAEDAFVEVAIWRVSPPVSPSRHRFKYRLAYVVASQCVLRYDNELGKGDHRHVGTVEAPYVFSTPDQLMADFNADIAGWNHEHGRS